MFWWTVESALEIWRCLTEVWCFLGIDCWSTFCQGFLFFICLCPWLRCPPLLFRFWVYSFPFWLGKVCLIFFWSWVHTNFLLWLMAAIPSFWSFFDWTELLPCGDPSIVWSRLGLLRTTPWTLGRDCLSWRASCGWEGTWSSFCTCWDRLSQTVPCPPTR